VRGAGSSTRTALLSVGEPAIVKLKVLPRVLAAMRPYLPPLG
jgi:hypothetical protein